MFRAISRACLWLLLAALAGLVQPGDKIREMTTWSETCPNGWRITGTRTPTMTARSRRMPLRDLRQTAKSRLLALGRALPASATASIAARD